MTADHLTAAEKRFSVCAVILTLAGIAIRFVPGMVFTTYLCLELAAVCLIWMILCRRVEYARTPHQKTLAVVCKRIFAAGCAVLVFMIAIAEGLVISCAIMDSSALSTGAVIVLGAGVNGTVPSLALQSRLNCAEEYLEEHPGIPVVLSGGQGPGEDITEADAMYTFLTARHPEWETRFIREDRATSTAENFRYSLALLEENGVAADTPVAVITNDFHKYRAGLIARRMNLNTVEIGVPLPWWWLTFNYYARESFALYKTLLFDR